MKLMPGVRMNLSRSGPSLSFGVRGAHLTVGRRGVTRTVGLPGTGVFYTSRKGTHSGVHTGRPLTHGRPDNRADLLRKLDDLHWAGVLTDAEWEQKRAAIETDAAAS
jgi:hypothetical protein